MVWYGREGRRGEGKVGEGRHLIDT
jgi:hypothetical protein